MGGDLRLGSGGLGIIIALDKGYMSKVEISENTCSFFFPFFFFLGRKKLYRKKGREYLLRDVFQSFKSFSLVDRQFLCSSCELKKK